jgi:DNA polymerase-1
LETAKLSDNMKNKLMTGKNMAFLSRTLSEICRTAPVSTDSEVYRYTGHDAEALRALFIQLNFTALIKKFGLDQIEETRSPITSNEQKQTSVAYVRVENPSELTGKQLFLDWSDTGVSAFDGSHLYETKSELSADGWKSLAQDKQVICFDFKRLYKKAKQCGFSEITCAFDCMLAAYVLDSGRSNDSMDELFVRYKGESLSAEMPLAIAVASLYEPLKREIEAGSFESLLYDIELPLASVLADMELRGFRVDCDGITAYGEELQAAADALQMRIYSYAGEEFNIGSPKQLGEVLFEKMGLPKSRKTKTGYSTDAEALQKLISRHPIIEDILDYRQVTKLKSTYADGLVKAADADGRIHSVLNQTGTATGRLSSSEPNLQNIPVRTELGRRFRQFFVPANDDYVLVDADYSQIELRLLAHISGDEAMIDSFLSGEDIHTMTAAKVFHVDPSQVTSDLRKKAKAVNFGIMYGIGEYSLSEDLGISRAQAKEYIDSYFEKFPQIRAYLDRVQEEARENGYVTTLFGRRRYIPELASSNKMTQHFGERIAMNSPIQGTAADIMKIAMISVAKALKESGYDAEMILQVHDELLIETRRECAEQVKVLLVDCMEQAVQLAIPLSVEANIGETWFDAK